MELDHMVPKADRGSNDIDNAIPVCFDCHAEIHAYNDRHPRGRKFRPEELREHKRQWLEYCKSNPGQLAHGNVRESSGPLEALIDELEYNAVIARNRGEKSALFVDEQFRRAISLGAFSLLDESTRTTVLSAYASMGADNQWRNDTAVQARRLERDENLGRRSTLRTVNNHLENITVRAKEALLKFLQLSQEDSGSG